MKSVDVAVVGGGPAGLAAAIATAQRGLSVVLFEKHAMPRDKACGEGIMPAGVRHLEALGVRSRLDPSGVSPLRGVRYVQEDGSQVDAVFPGQSGLGIRRLTLVDAMTARAQELGVEVRSRCPLLGYVRTSRGVTLTLPTESTELMESMEAQVLVAADGLLSPLRQREGLDGPPSSSHRFGLRQHFRCAPWSDFVEVHLADGAEAYVTPAGPERVGVAFLWEKSRKKSEIPSAMAPASSASVVQWLARFPRLAERLQDVPVDSAPRGAGPFAHAVRGVTRDRFILMGDAAGYVDAITGEGISLALRCAEALGETLPQAIRQGASVWNLRPYERAVRRAYRPYQISTNAVLWLARHPPLRRAVLRGFSSCPSLFSAVVGVVAGR